MDIRSYLAEGEELERRCSPAPWAAMERLLDARIVVCYDDCLNRTDCYLSKNDARFMVDARERLPRYRKALEAVLDALDRPFDERGLTLYDLGVTKAREAIYKALSE